MSEAVESRRHVQYANVSNTETYREEPVISVTGEDQDARRTLRRRENTRARLVEAALGVFAEKGVKRVTVDDLVGAAGFTRGAFYSNFTSIDEVFFAVFEQQSRRLLDAVRERIESIPDQDFSIEALVPVLDGLLPSSRTWYVVQAEFTLFALRSPEAQRVYAEHHRALQGEIEAMMAGIVARLGREPVVPLPMLTETVVGLWLQALGQESLGIGELDTASVTGTVLPHVLLGLSRPV